MRRSRPKPSPIKVRKPDPATGELVEAEVTAGYFQVKRPIWPATEHAEREKLEANYWAFYADQLTPDECRSIVRGSFSVWRPVEPGWAKGDVLEVASKITATVLLVEEGDEGHRTTFRVRNDRPVLLRRVPAITSLPKLDSDGFPIKPTAEAIEDARIDGNYTTSASLAVADAGDAMDDTLYARIHGEASAANAIRGLKQKAQADKLQLETELRDAFRRGRRGKARALQKKLEQQEKRQNHAA